jgi:hypothetical protein
MLHVENRVLAPSAEATQSNAFDSLLIMQKMKQIIQLVAIFLQRTRSIANV